MGLFAVPESWLPPIVPVQRDHGNIFNTNIELKVVIDDQQIGHNGLQKTLQPQIMGHQQAYSLI